MKAERLAIVCDSVCFCINFICSIQSVLTSADFPIIIVIIVIIICLSQHRGPTYC